MLRTCLKCVRVASFSTVCKFELRMVSDIYFEAYIFSRQTLYSQNFMSASFNRVLESERCLKFSRCAEWFVFFQLFCLLDSYIWRYRTLWQSDWLTLKCFGFLLHGTFPMCWDFPASTKRSVSISTNKTMLTVGIRKLLSQTGRQFPVLERLNHIHVYVFSGISLFKTYEDRIFQVGLFRQTNHYAS